jgi:hypothetical protein
MRGYSKMSDEERQQITKLHATPYNGYAVGNVPSNMTPLSVYDATNDKNGITVTNTGNVTTYKNHNINERYAKNLHYDSIDEPYQFKSGGPVDPFREEYDDENFEEIDEDSVEMWKDVENPEVESVEDLTESINKTLTMFKKFKTYN